MATDATLEKYRQKISAMATDALRTEIGDLEDKIVRVAGELYALDVSPDSLDQNMSYKGKVQSRVNNQGTWDRKLDAAIAELKGRGEEYAPSEEYGKMCDVANDIFGAVRIVYAVRTEDGKSSGYDFVLGPLGLGVKPSYGGFKPTFAPLKGPAVTVLINGLLNNHVYMWGGTYNKPGNKGRGRWIMDIYTSDGGCISFKGNAYRPHNMEAVELVMFSAAMMR